MEAPLKRNIVVIGKTGSGKSTLANKILCLDDDDRRCFEVKPSYQAVTTEIQNMISKIRMGSTTYEINMIDTIGFTDTREKGAKSDDAIMKEIKKEMQDRAPEGVNLLIFVFKHGRFTKEERVVFDKIQKNFSQLINRISMLIITNCDALTKEAREKVIADFRSDPLTKDFAKMMTKGIYTVGFPDTKTINPMFKPAMLQCMKEDMYPIHKLIADASSRFLQYELKFDEKFWLQIATVCNYL